MTLRTQYLELLEKMDFAGALAMLMSNGVECDAIPEKLAAYTHSPNKDIRTGIGYELFTLMVGHIDHPNFL